MAGEGLGLERDIWRVAGEGPRRTFLAAVHLPNSAEVHTHPVIELNAEGLLEKIVQSETKRGVRKPISPPRDLTLSPAGEGFPSSRGALQRFLSWGQRWIPSEWLLGVGCVLGMTGDWQRPAWGTRGGLERVALAPLSRLDSDLEAGVLR